MYYFCIGLLDGDNVVFGFIWILFYIICLLNRIIVENMCEKGVFDLYKRICIIFVVVGK